MSRLPWGWACAPRRATRDLLLLVIARRIAFGGSPLFQQGELDVFQSSEKTFSRNSASAAGLPAVLAKDARLYAGRFGVHLTKVAFPILIPATH